MKDGLEYLNHMSVGLGAGISEKTKTTFILLTQTYSHGRRVFVIKRKYIPVQKYIASS